MALVFLVIVSEDDLVGDEGRENCDAVIFQSPMPDAIVQVEDLFEVTIEGLHRHAASAIQPASAR